MPPTRVPQAQTPDVAAAALREFFASEAAAIVSEDGKILFDMRRAKAEIASQHGACTIHLWSDERNLLRRVVGTEQRGKALRVAVLKFGSARPTLLEVSAEKERRTPGTREQTRVRYLKVLERALHRQWPEWKAGAFRTAMDLEKSFGPAYARGTLVHGNRAWAVIGVNDEEAVATIDGVLTFGILWLQHCRETTTKRVVQGLRVVVPNGMGTLTLSRMAWLHGGEREWELWELDQRAEELEQRDLLDQGNLTTRLVHLPNEQRGKDRFVEAAAHVMALVPKSERAQVEQRLRKSTELAFLLHGLEFARVRVRASDGSFNHVEVVTVGTGASETPLTAENEPALRALVAELFARRKPTGDQRDALFRMQPERWLEGELRRSLEAIDDTFDPAHCYSQMAAFAAGDRGMLDLLTVAEDGRLVVIEVKAEEDPQLALQGLDYWVRVRWHHAQNPDPATGLGEFQRHGYFAEVRLSAKPPRLLLVAPALRIHPATEVVLRHFDPRVEWTLVAVNEAWRNGIQVVWRKRSAL
jgi:hypothetical protein